MMELDIKGYTDRWMDELKLKVRQLNVDKELAIIVSYASYAADSYINGIIKDMNYVGLKYKVYNQLDRSNMLYNLERVSHELDHVGSILLTAPYPDESTINAAKRIINPNKDIENFSGKNKYVYPCTAWGIYTYLKDQFKSLENANITIINRSDRIGKPLFELLLKDNANVSILHSFTSINRMIEYIENSDIVVTGIGKEGFLDYSKIFNYKNRNTMFIDAGTCFVHGKIYGDIDRRCYDDIKFGSYTPVPKGVGLLTRCALIDNIITLHVMQN